MEEPEREILPPEPGSMESSAWLLFLDQLLRLTITFALIAALIWAIVLLIRSIIRGFYGRTGEVRELVREGFTEEEQRLSGNPKKREKRLPFWGGTMQQRLRRTFLKTVQESCPKENGLSAMTAREIAALAAERQQKAADTVTDSRQNPAGTVTDGQEKWNRLAGLYEKARYTEETINSEDVRTAGKLSREILHNIK